MPLLHLSFTKCTEEEKKIFVSEVDYMKGSNQERWINVDEAADYFGVKPATIRDWIKKKNGIPAVKIGRSWRFKYSELDTWAKSGAAAEETITEQSEVGK
jgi:excisionase family DNA binding protein